MPEDYDPFSKVGAALASGMLQVDLSALYEAGLQLQAARDELLAAYEQVVGLSSGLDVGGVPRTIDGVGGAWDHAHGWSTSPNQGVAAQLMGHLIDVNALLEHLSSSVSKYRETERRSTRDLHGIRR